MSFGWLVEVMRRLCVAAGNFGQVSPFKKIVMSLHVQSTVIGVLVWCMSQMDPLLCARKQEHEGLSPGEGRFLLLFLLQRNSVFVLSINDDFPR